MAVESTSSGDTVEQAQEAAARLSDRVRSAGSRMRDVAQEKAGNIREKAGEYYQHGAERAREWEQNFERVVRDRPLQSLMVAVGVGVVLGLLWRRR